MTVTDFFQIRTYAEQIYLQFALGDESQTIVLSGLSDLLISVALVCIALWVIARLMMQPPQLGPRRQLRIPLRRWRLPLSIAVWACIGLHVAVPTTALFTRAGQVVTLLDGQWQRSWSLGSLLSVVGESPWRFRRELGWSLGCASLAAVAAVAIAAPLAWRARRGGRAALLPAVSAAVCLAVPGPLLGVLVVWLLNRPSLAMLYDRTVFAPCLVQAIKALPVAILILWHAFSGLPRELEQAAASEGASRPQMFRRMGLAGQGRSIGAALIAALLVALGELSATLLVTPPGFTPLSVRTFGLVHGGLDTLLAGLCLLQWGATLLAAIVVVRLVRPRQA